VVFEVDLEYHFDVIEKMNYENLLNRITDSDVNIRHSVVTDSEGEILATSHRDGVKSRLSNMC
jgi:hypothetical protein